MEKSTLLYNEIHLFAVTNTVKKMKIYLLTLILRTGILLCLLLCLPSVFCAGNKKEKAVLQAYQLRVEGKVDEAKNQLELILKQDSTNAMAHFELSRTLNYMNKMGGSKQAELHLKKALELDPDNVIYANYRAGNCFLKAYIAMHKGDDKVKKLIHTACNEYLMVLKLKPDYAEALMYLVEIYGLLPGEMGGDKAEAEKYIQQLEELDKFYGAKARSTVMPEGTDMIAYWEKYMKENGEDCKALKELAVACIFKDDIEGAKVTIDKMMEMDKSHQIRLLDLARYHHMKVMQNRDLANAELPKSKVYIEQYLNTVPEPITPLKAYAIGMLAKTEMFLGNREEGQKLMAEAKTLDPYFSRAFGIPSLNNFEAPDVINHHFSSFFSPF